MPCIDAPTNLSPRTPLAVRAERFKPLGCTSTPHIERRGKRPGQCAAKLGVLFAAALLSACNVMPDNRMPTPAAPAPAATATPAVPAQAPAPAAATAATRPSIPAPASTAARPALPPVTTWAAYRERAAALVMAANPQATYSGPVPDPLASIPVLQVQLNADGSIRNIEVLRVPKFEPQTVEMAKVAMARAAPFGPVGNLPRPWQFNETFLYNDDLKFQLHTLVDGK